MVQASIGMTFWYAAFAFAVSSAGVWVGIRVARRLGAVDIPNERSSHSLPTPRVGGLPMVAAAAVGLGAWLVAGSGVEGLPRGLICTLLFALAMFFLGLCDDLRGLPAWFRLLVQIASAALLFVFLAPAFRAVRLGIWELPGTALVLPGAAWAVWMTNLYNFMDGIDGLAAGEAAIASSFLFLVFAHYGEFGWAAANLIVAAAAAGFLVFNWPPARIFLGDGGSLFLGAFYGMQATVAALTTPVSFVALVLPFCNFILDTTFTLIRRFCRGEKWYRAHRTHFYQRMTNMGMTHRAVSSLELFAAAASCLVATAWIFASGSVRVLSAGLLIAGLVTIGTWVRTAEMHRQSPRR